MEIKACSIIVIVIEAGASFTHHENEGKREGGGRDILKAVVNQQIKYRKNAYKY